MAAKHNLTLKLRADQRLAILGRLRMADWIEMPERKFAREIEKLEKDDLFRKLAFGSPSLPGAIRRQRWPRARLSSGFYEMNEGTLAGGERVRVEEHLEERAHLLPLIRRMGQENFERYFLHAEDPLPLDEIARRTGLEPEEARAIHDFLLEIGAQEEFYLPAREPRMQRSYACLAKISMPDERPEFEFYSPYWARGLYQIRYDLLEDWKGSAELTGSERRRLRHLLKRIETINLRQNTLFRIMESLTQLQTRYLLTKDPAVLRPLSLRMLARRLQLSPSTVSRAVSSRSVLLPWGKETPLAVFMPGQRRVVREIMTLWLGKGEPGSDAAFSDRLKREYGIVISRRTVNAVRNEIKRRSS